MNLPDSRPLRKVAGFLLVLLSVGLFVWSAWLYHLASVARTTDETTGFYIAVGSVVVGLGAAVAFIGVRFLHQGR